MTEPFLRYFADFLPLAEQITPTGRTIEQMHAAHDANPGPNAAALGADAAVLRQVLIEAEVQWQEQIRMAHALADCWRGGSATRAQEVMLGSLARVGDALAAVREAVDALEAAQAAFTDVTRARADAFGCFPVTVDGHTMQAVAAKVDRAIDSNDSDCLAWLDNVFLTHVRESLEVFDEICRTSENAVATTMEVIDRTLVRVDEHGAGLAVAALASAGGIAIATGALALTIGAELADEFAPHDEPSEAAPPRESEQTTQPEAELHAGVQSTPTQHLGTEPPRDEARDEGRAGYETPPASNEPVIALEVTESDAVQPDSSDGSGEPLLASVGEQAPGKHPEVQLGEAGPL